MIIVNLKGGLGNQMFQYAAGKRMALANNDELKLDLAFFETPRRKALVTPRRYELSILKITESFASVGEIGAVKNFRNRLVNKFFPHNTSNPYFKERHFQFDAAFLSLTGDRYLDGHWMSEKYFQDIESTLRQEFTFRKPVLEKGQGMLSQIKNSNAVCIQVRRGDYVTNPKVAKLHQTTSLAYFNRAIALIKSKVEAPAFFIFSDDSKWCLENFRDIGNVFFVEEELINEGASNSDYLQLMSACKYFIISNSTFGWWAAWLSSNKAKIVVAPSNWFNDKSIVTTDIYPPSWMKI